MKIVVSDPKTGSSWQRELEKAREAQLYGRKIGETIDGATMGLEGYSLKITGGSDRDGTTMRAEIPGTGRAQALLSEPPGIRMLRIKKRGERKLPKWKLRKYKLQKGVKIRRLVRGNTVSNEIVQVNTIISNYGPKSLEELGFAAKAKEKEGAARKQAEAKEQGEGKQEKAPKKAKG